MKLQINTTQTNCGSEFGVTRFQMKNPHSLYTLLSKKISILTLSCVMFKNGQTHCKIFKVYLVIFQH